jgi:hypothetical protein
MTILPAAEATKGINNNKTKTKISATGSEKYSLISRMEFL